MKTLPPKLYSFLCACFAAMGAATFGYDLSVISYVLEAPDFKTTIKTDDTNYIGFITSSLLLGAFVGSIPASYVADIFSRRTAITVAGSIFIVGAAIQAATQNKEMMMAGRFIAGIGIGQMGVLTPLYQSEIAHPSNRGRLTATFQFFLGIGAFIAGWIGYGCQQGAMGKPLQWRLPLAFQAMPALPLVILTFLLPESPRWLMIKGRQDEALQTLARLHARGNVNDPVVVGEFTAIKAQLEEAGALDSSWSAIYKDAVNMRKVSFGIILQFSVQMTGVSAIQYYAGTVYTSVGFAKDALLINSINSVNGLIGQVLCVLFLDKFGRRPPLIWGNILSGTTFAIATALAKQFANGGGTKGQGIAFVAMIYIYNLGFSSCIGPLSWVIPVEIMQNNIRAKAVGVTTMASWLANFVIGQVSPKAFQNIGWKYYLVFTVCSFTNALFFWLFLHETKGRTLEEMDHLLRTAHIIVPLAKVEKIDATTREREFAENYQDVDLSKQQEAMYIESKDNHAMGGVSQA